METVPKEVIQRKGSRVKICYTLSTEEGDIIKGDPREGRAVLELFTGYDQVLPALESTLIGRKQGDKARVVIPPQDAFGLYEARLVKVKTYEEVPQGRDLVEGKWVMARDEKTKAAYSYFVKKKTDDYIVLDYNHPLAGKTLIYDLEIIEVRESTPEERSLLRPCEVSGGSLAPPAEESSGER